MKSVLNNLLSNSYLLVVSALSILTPIKPLMLVVGFLVATDFIFGVSRSIKLYGWESIKSNKMSHTVSKMLLYNLTIISVYLLETYIIQTGLPLAKLAAGLISLAEIKSLDESFESLFGWSMWSKLQKLIKRNISTTKI